MSREYVVRCVSDIANKNSKITFRHHLNIEIVRLYSRLECKNGGAFKKKGDVQRGKGRKNNRLTHQKTKVCATFELWKDESKKKRLERKRVWPWKNQQTRVISKTKNVSNRGQIRRSNCVIHSQTMFHHKYALQKRWKNRRFWLGLLSTECETVGHFFFSSLGIARIQWDPIIWFVERGPAQVSDILSAGSLRMSSINTAICTVLSYLPLPHEARLSKIIIVTTSKTNNTTRAMCKKKMKYQCSHRLKIHTFGVEKTGESEQNNSEPASGVICFCFIWYVYLSIRLVFLKNLRGISQSTR